MKSILNFYEVIDDLPKSPPLPILPNPNQRIVDAARRASQTPVSQPSFFRDVVHKSLTTNPFGAKKAETSKWDMPEKFNPPVKKLSAPERVNFDRGNASPASPAPSPERVNFDRGNASPASPAPAPERVNFDRGNASPASPAPAPERVNFDRGNANPAGGNTKFMVDKAASIKSQLSPKIDNNAKLMNAKADATRGAEDYKAAHPVSTPSASAPSRSPASIFPASQFNANRVVPGAISTPVTSVAPPINTSSMPSRFDFKAAAEAGTAVNAAKKVGGTLLDKIKDPDIINRGAQVMSKLGDVTGYGK